MSHWPRTLFSVAALAVGATQVSSSAGEADVCRDRASVLGAVGDAGCSALLVSNDLALTAAHCIDPRRHLLQSIRFGRGAAQRSVSVTRCEAHPRFDGVGADFDLALCWLKEPVTDVVAVQLSSSPPSARAGESACVIGFRGATASRGVKSSPARVKQQPSAATARLAFESCAGDSGSLAFLERDGKLVPFGVLSGGEAGQTECSRTTLLARVGPALDWLNSRR